jgi:alcohol dehydrogenase (NADP+)
MEKLVRPGGPVRFIGVSNFSPKQMQELLAAAKIRPKVHQFETHPYLQQAEFVEWHHKNGIPVVGYAPLANTSPYYSYANRENPAHPPILTVEPTLRQIAQDRGCTSAQQVTLAWNMKRGVAVIPKAQRVEHQQENIGVEKCKLTEEDMKKITGISAQYTGRFNNPCRKIGMPCFEGLANKDQGR